MKILFVCRANTGRSQMAMEFYNQRHPGSAQSAGVGVDQPGQRLKDRPAAINSLAVMREIGIDMSENVRVQLTPEMIKPYDRVIVLLESAETPEWLRNNPKVEMWEIDDPAPGAATGTIDSMRRARDQVRERIELFDSA